MVGSAKGKSMMIDCWRQKVFYEFLSSRSKITDQKWTLFPQNMICSVGFDGVVKLCLLDRFVKGDSNTESGGVRTNNLEIHNPGQQI